MADPVTLDGRTTLQGGSQPVTVMNGAASPVPVTAISGALPAGAATESQQIATNTVLGQTGDAAVVTNIAGTISAKLRGLVAIFADVWDAINHHLQVSTVQEVIADNNNSSTTNLTAVNGYTFTGTGTSTLGIVGIQVSLFANQNCIVYVEQSPDNINWDIIDPFYYTASKTNFGVTVQAINSYVRVRVTTNSATTTTFRLQTCLCPMVEAVPRTLDPQGYFKVSLQGDGFGNGPAQFTPNQELLISPRYRLVGSQFEGATLDTNFWTTSVSTGTVALSGSNVTITSGTANGHYARLYSNRRARFVSGATNKFRCHMRLGDTGTANVKRRWGIAYGAAMPTITDGAYFELDGTTFSVVTLKTGGEARVSSGSFNGQYGYTYAVTTSNTTWEILYGNGNVQFIVNGILLHKVTASAATWSDTMHFHVWMDVSNSGASATVSFYTRTAHIATLGNMLTQPTSYYFASGTTAGVNLKLGPGNIHTVIVNNVANNAVITLSDSTTAATPAIWVHTAGAASTAAYALDFQGAPFYTGLRLTVASFNASVTVIYE